MVNMRRTQIATMDLSVALSAFRVERLLQSGIHSHIDQAFRRMRAKSRTGAVTGMTSQTNKRNGLVHQIVFDRAMGTVTDSAVFSYRRVFIDKRSLLVSVALVAKQIQRRLF